jgi:hypothetical protein
MKNFDNYLFRCSSLGHLMTEPKTKTEPLSEGTKTHLVDVYVSAKYKRKDDISNRYLEKGTLVEEDSITLLSRVEKTFFKKNEEHLFNAFIKGTPDIFEGKSIYEAEEITDTKSSWDIYTFMRAISKKTNPLYYWQGQGYLWLSGANKFKLSYCLVNTPSHLIDSEKRKLGWQMGVIDPLANSDYFEGCKEIEKNSIYDIKTFVSQNPGYDLLHAVDEWQSLGLDIPMNERVSTMAIDRNDEDIERLKSRIINCRIWLNDFEKNRNKIS